MTTARSARPREARRPAMLAVLSIVIAALGAGIWSAFVPYSRERQTELGPMPLNSQDEVRVTGVVWLVIGLAVLGLALAFLWWFLGPRRGPGALGLLGLLAAATGGTALLVYNLVVRARAGSPTLTVGDDYDLLFSVSWAAPVLTPALVAVTCYTILSIGSRRDDLARAHEAPGAATHQVPGAAAHQVPGAAVHQVPGEMVPGVMQDDGQPVVELTGVHDPAQEPRSISRDEHA